jgi:hypothetical protein
MRARSAYASASVSATVTHEALVAHGRRQAWVARCDPDQHGRLTGPEGGSHMMWHWQSTCSACAFVSRQLGSSTPCPWHSGMWSAPVFEEPSISATPLPSADCPWPFTLREYARLMLLRGQVRQEHPSAPSDIPFEAVRGGWS